MGEELGQLEKLKIDAVVNEDFAVKRNHPLYCAWLMIASSQRAESIKQQAFEFRQKVYASLGITATGQPISAPVTVIKRVRFYRY